MVNLISPKIPSIFPQVPRRTAVPDAAPPLSPAPAAQPAPCTGPRCPVLRGQWARLQLRGLRPRQRHGAGDAARGGPPGPLLRQGGGRRWRRQPRRLIAIRQKK